MNNKTTEEIVNTMWGKHRNPAESKMGQRAFTAAITPYIELYKAARRFARNETEQNLCIMREALNNIPKI